MVTPLEAAPPKDHGETPTLLSLTVSTYSGKLPCCGVASSHEAESWGLGRGGEGHALCVLRKTAAIAWDSGRDELHLSWVSSADRWPPSLLCQEGIVPKEQMLGQVVPALDHNRG